LLFAFSITPRKTLHDLFVSHTDGTPVGVKNGEAQLSTAGFYCDTQSLVAESAFTATHGFAVVTPFVVFSQPSTVHLYQVHRLTHFFFSLRGPPSFS
jgi:hypothetical protein